MNFTFRTISGIFESTSGFWFLLPVHRFRFIAPGFRAASTFSRLSAIRQPYGQKIAKRNVPGALQAKPEVEIWRRPDFLTQPPRLPIRPPIHKSVYLSPLRSFRELKSKVGQSTQLLPVLQIYLRFDHDDFFRNFFRIIVNLTIFRTFSDIFETTSGFWILLPVHKCRYVAPSFLIRSMSSRISAIRQPHGPENGKKERTRGWRGQTGSRNMAATRFLDSATPTSYSTSNTRECLSLTVTEF